MIKRLFHGDTELHLLNHPPKLIADGRWHLAADGLHRLEGREAGAQAIHHEVEHVAKLIIELLQP